MTEQIKKYIFYVALSIVVIYLLRKLVLSIKYGAQKESSYNVNNLPQNKSFYSGIAIGIKNAIYDIPVNSENTRLAITNLLDLNDDEVKFTYNVYNANYTSGSETLTTHIKDEFFLDVPFFTYVRERYNVRAKKLGLG